MLHRIPFYYLVKLLPYIKIMGVLKLIYIIKVIQYTFLFQTGMLHNESDKHGIILIPMYVPTHLNLEAD